jgi:signal transduction histidine kinase
MRDGPLVDLNERIGEAERGGATGDLTARRLRFLAEAGKTLSASLDYETTLRNVANLAVPAVADWCVIDLIDEQGELQRLTIAHEDPAMIQFVRELREKYPEDPESRYGVREVIRSGEPQLVTEISPEMLREVAQDEEHLRLIEALHLGSYIVVPLQARGRMLGALTLVCSITAHCYDTDDLEMARELAVRAAVAIDNARLVRELEQTQSHLEQTAAELEAQAEELQATVEELEATTQDLIAANDEARAAREEAERARAHAEDANAAKSSFLATMSHELRTPLNAIGGYAELMELGIHGPLTDPQREALRRLRRAQKRLLSLINDVLNFARLEAGQVRFHYRDVPVASILANLETVIAPQLAARQQTLAIDDVRPGLRVHADPEKAEQILLNLLANAIKFTAPGGRIHVKTSAQGPEVWIRVTDTGAGIEAERLDTIFEPFVQVDGGMIREHGGVGLGLSISRDLAQAMSGDVRVESQVGRGSTFTLVLPLSQGAA